MPADTYVTPSGRIRRRQPSGAYAEPVAFRSDPTARHAINGNPNRGKRRDAGSVVTPASATGREYSPLTVSHPTLDRIGRRNPRTRTSYTV